MDQLLPYYFTPDIDCGVRVAQTIGTSEIYRYMESQKLSRRKEGEKRMLCRGDLYYADLSPVVGCEQGGVRPVLIVQNDVGNRYSPTVIVAAVTSRMEKHPLPTHVFINRNSVLQKDSIIMLEQIRTIDKSRLLEYIGHLDCRDMRAVDVSLRISLDMGTDTSGTFWEERQKQGLVLT